VAGADAARVTATAVSRTDRDGVVELRLDRAEARNALTTGLLRELRGHLRDVQDDPDVRVLLLTGDGPVFCAGADLQELGPDAPADARQARIRLVSDVLAHLLQLERPTIAAVQGAAVGAGWGLALACDVCLASADAAFSLPELAKGFRLPQLLVRRLVQLAGPMRAAEIAYAGTKRTAAEALAAGCVARVLPDDDALHAAAWELATALARQPRSSVASMKQPLRALAPQTPNPPPELDWTEE
jgi:enoyl-CoA hydratase/carnithine racemase